MCRDFFMMERQYCGLAACNPAALKRTPKLAGVRIPKLSGAEALRLATADALCRSSSRRGQFKEAVFAVESEDSLGG